MAVFKQHKTDVISILSSSIVQGVKTGLLFGLILGLSDVFLGMFYVEMNIRTYIGFSIAYIGMCMVLGIMVSFVFNISVTTDKSEADYLAWLFFVGLFFYDFVYINWKLLGGFDVLLLKEVVAHFSKIRVMVVNALLLLSLVFLKKCSYKIRAAQEYLSNIWDFIPVVVMAFGFTAALNHLVLRWPSSPRGFVTVLALTLCIVAIPAIAIVFKIVSDTFFGILTKSVVIQRFLGWSFAVFLVLFIPLTVKHPNYSLFQNAPYEPDETKLAQLKGKPNVILIVLDTARKDHFSCYGYVRNTTPHIDKFSKDGVLFTNFISASPWTIPSHASVFTGMYPSKHGSHHSDDALFLPLPDECVTLAEILRDYGYNTEAVVANYILQRTTRIDQGFNFYIDESALINNFFWGLICCSSEVLTSKVIENAKVFRINKYKLSSEINEIVFHRLRRNNGCPFFLFINYLEPHYGAYHLPGNFVSQYGFDWGKWEEVDQSKYVYKQKKVEKEFQQNFFNLMDSRILYMDSHIGVLFAKLKELDLYDNSMIIVASDHGELFGEHYSFGHTREVYNELIHVPLIIKYPGERDYKGVNDRYVQTVDIMPEVLSVLDIPIPEDIQGQPIYEANHKIVAELFRNKTVAQPNPDRYYRDLRAIISYDDHDGMTYKYIQSSKGESELFNFSGDPYEDNNLLSEMAEKAEDFNNELEEWRQSFRTVKDADKVQKPIDKESLERLRALGYVR